MDKATRERYQARAEIIKAMAHPTRLFIVDQLSRQEMCVTELTLLVGADVSTVSKHLTVLRGAGIIKDQRRGSQVYYRLLVPCVLGFFSCVEAVLKKSALQMARLASS